MEAIVTLTTDFGSIDAYAAAMKGVILGINPQAKLIDVCHSVQPQNIREAAFILKTAYPFFPDGTIHIVVVDPGVGTARRAVILKTPSALFIAPDNGVLSYVIQPSLSGYDEDKTRLYQVELPDKMEAVAITNPEYWRSPVSPTFHGRDIFAPVAAHLSLGVPLGSFGKKINSVAMLPLPHPRLADDGSLVGHILHIDNFGNLITDVTSTDLPPTEAISVEVGSQLISGARRTYADGKGLLILIGSSGHMEIALNTGNAASFLKAKVGNEIRVRYASTT